MAKKLLEPVKVSRLWVNDPKTGQGSVSVTLLMVSFAVVCLGYLASVVETVGPFSFRAFDPAGATTLFSPIVALYFSRKWTGAKYGQDKNGDVASSDE